MDLCDQSASALAGLLKKGEVSSREITESVFKRIDERDGSLNAFITKTRKTALSQADAADERLKRGEDTSPLNGIPIAVKDNLCTQGIKTTCGSNILNNYVPTYNATAVEKILRSGCTLIGKTNLDEFGMGSSTEHSIIGPHTKPCQHRLRFRGVQRRFGNSSCRRGEHPGPGYGYGRFHSSAVGPFVVLWG